MESGDSLRVQKQIADHLMEKIGDLAVKDKEKLPLLRRERSLLVAFDLFKLLLPTQIGN
jgi:hypothetical protein